MLKSYHIIYADVYSENLLVNEHLNVLDNSQLSTTSCFPSINGLKWLSSDHTVSYFSTTLLKLYAFFKKKKRTNIIHAIFIKSLSILI